MKSIQEAQLLMLLKKGHALLDRAEIIIAQMAAAQHAPVKKAA